MSLQPNEGRVSDSAGLQSMCSAFSEQGVNTTTFGIGNPFNKHQIFKRKYFSSCVSGDGFNEELMSGMAEKGSGDYFFIDDAENILSLVKKGLDRTLRLVGIIQMRILHEKQNPSFALI